MIRERVIRSFARRFAAEPTLVVRAPGRVNLIGDHTDYNEGFVLPMAIDRAVWIALRPREDRRVSVESVNFHEHWEMDLDALPTQPAGWAAYVYAIIAAFREAGLSLSGWDGIIVGDVPVGAGLSSSAALELATARAFVGMAEGDWQPAPMARLAQHAEQHWVGVQCGIMDQLIAATGRSGYAMLIDCRSLELRPVRLPHEAAVVVLDTATRRGLVESAYNERRAQCERAAAALGVASLRDVDRRLLESASPQLDALTLKRARHVVTENARTLAAADALIAGDVQEVGRLMSESHVSLRDDFEVSGKELDVMVQLAQGHWGCYGARMTGAGFGGCVVALVGAVAADTFAQDMAKGYQARTGLLPSVYVCEAADGATLEQNVRV